MRKFFNGLKAVIAGCLLTMMFSCSASSLSGQSFIGSDLVSAVFSKAHQLDLKVKGFGGGAKRFGMNFGGGNTVKKPMSGNTAKNTAAAGAKTGSRGFWGMLAGFGIFSWLLLGAGALGVGFIIFMLAMMVIPMIMAAIGGKAQRSANDLERDLPTSSYSSDDLFGDRNKDKENRFKKF